MRSKSEELMLRIREYIESSVSYTHLDVYKRQGVGNRIAVGRVLSGNGHVFRNI